MTAALEDDADEVRLPLATRTDPPTATPSDSTRMANVASILLSVDA
jgi:hypothetical protein